MKTRVLLGAVAALAFGVATTAPAEATLILEEGLVGGSGDVDNLQFNPCGLGSSTGTTVQGCLNDPNDTRVNISSTEELTISGGGQAKIEATDGAFDNFTITLDDPTLGFSKLQFNILAVADGTATFTAVDQFGNVFVFGNIALDGNGNNFFTLGSADGQVAVSFSLQSTVALQNVSSLEQVRLGPTELTVTVPEPASMALLGTGLLGLGMFARRRREKASA